MQTASNRTFICSIVFLDIVEYSKKPVAEQIMFKERLNNLLTEALAEVPPNDRIILDTGDGAALSFLGDPEDALFASLSLREALAAAQPLGPQMKMRIGINLGPVKLVKDINGQPNIIGDGINVAQRVMSFSEPGQILASRSFYEVVSRMDGEYDNLFHYEGSRTDKHVREHEVYAVQATATPLKHPKRARSASTSQSQPMFDRLAQSASFVTGSLRKRPRLGTALAVVAILVVAAGIRSQRQPAAPAAIPSPPPSKVAAAPAPTPAPAPSSAPAPAAPKAAVEAPEKPAAPAARKPASAPAARKDPPPAPPASGGTGTLVLTIRPWGEVYVDGRHIGTAPPLHELRLAAGRHRIEIQNSDFPSHVRTVDVHPGARVAITYWFQPKEQPNPLNRIWK